MKKESEESFKYHFEFFPSVINLKLGYFSSLLGGIIFTRYVLLFMLGEYLISIMGIDLVGRGEVADGEFFSLLDGLSLTRLKNGSLNFVFGDGGWGKVV